MLHTIQLCENPSKWALHVVKPLPFCVRNRVALIGDAVRLSQGWVLQERFIDERSNPLVSWHGALHGCRCRSSDRRASFHNLVAGFLLLKQCLGCIYPWPADRVSSYAALSRPRCPPYLRGNSAPDCSFYCQPFVVGWMDVHLHGTRVL